MLPIEFLRRKGARIGKGCRIYTKFCCTEPYLLSIGNNVSIGVGVELLTHDGAIWVLRHIRKNPNLDWFAPIEIGDNVFIGNGVKILPGVTIGTNVIIGANSVVTKSLSSNKIYAGTPAQEVSNIESYCNKKIIGCVETKTMSQREKQIYLSNKSPS
jgi:acetyltransferase-like isoleucine patch superfamily enzyme